MKKKIEATIAAKQTGHIVFLATEVNETLSKTYGSKDSYNHSEISASLTEHGFPTQRNAINRFKNDPLIAHAMFMSWNEFLKHYADGGYQVQDFLYLRQSIAKSLFKGTSWHSERDSVLISPDGLRLLYQAKLFVVENPND